MKLLVFLLFLSCAIASDRIKGSVGGNTYGGFIQVNKQFGAYLYYYFIESQNNPATDPVVLWLQGGPGCSSLFGNFVENGPVLITANGTFNSNPYSWNAKANVLYIDSPVGSGYSYVESTLGYVTNEKTLSVELYNALYSFLFTLHPEYSKQAFYIFGESYAGKYVPWLTTTVITNNKIAPNKINLQGIGVGDGWVSPYYQAGSYAPFLYANNRIDYVELESSNVLYEAYKVLIDSGSYVTAQALGNTILETLVVAGGIGDVYDIRKASDPTDPLGVALGVYLNLPATRQKMNAGTQVWTMCSTTPYFALIDDLARSSEVLFPQILAAQVPVLLYNGNYDLICNMMGTTTWAANLNWPFQNAFNTATNQSWIVAGQPAGYYKTSNGLAQLIVYNAGHMVPYDQPQNAQDLLYRFISGGFSK